MTHRPRPAKAFDLELELELDDLRPPPRSQERLLSSKYGVAASEILSPPRNFKQGGCGSSCLISILPVPPVPSGKAGGGVPTMRPSTDEWQDGTLSSSVEKSWLTLYRGSRLQPAGYPSQGACLQPVETRMHDMALRRSVEAPNTLKFWRASRDPTAKCCAGHTLSESYPCTNSTDSTEGWRSAEGSCSIRGRRSKAYMIIE